ncbi:MAG: hypothetical protein JNJ45_06635 [Chthonomonas sp.]|nr:hypothetical protein [Chthonomonas sp.]
MELLELAGAPSGLLKGLVHLTERVEMKGDIEFAQGFRPKSELSSTNSIGIQQVVGGKPATIFIDRIDKV